jgi:hypothetical protein
MNALEALELGHQAALDAVKDLPAAGWKKSITRESWSVKDVIAHLASHEYIMIDVIRANFFGGSVPTWSRWMQNASKFDREEVARRRGSSVADVLNEYTEAHLETINLLIRVPSAAQEWVGLLPWYGVEYAVADFPFVLGSFYGHKLAHSAQIAASRNLIPVNTTPQLKFQPLLSA